MWSCQLKWNSVSENFHHLICVHLGFLLSFLSFPEEDLHEGPCAQAWHLRRGTGRQRCSIRLLTGRTFTYTGLAGFILLDASALQDPISISMFPSVFPVTEPHKFPCTTTSCLWPCYNRCFARFRVMLNFGPCKIVFSPARVSEGE